MRSRITQDAGQRRAGTSVKLSTFEILGEEDEILEHSRREAERQKEEEARRERERLDLEKVRDMNWADVDDDEDYSPPQQPQPEKASPDEEEEQDEEPPAEISISVKPPAAKKQAKGKKATEDIDSLLANLQAKSGGSGESKKSAGATTSEPADSGLAGTTSEDRTKAVAQLRAKIAASRAPKKAAGEEEGNKKKSKSQKREAKRMYER
eukprot:Protomagalhaensia_sp_Gyna_25__3098@NODE_2841_length_863_cov_144_740291_g2370_i0_p1_GENE_NODE_2841_length_863_cov_144_740291_g2370_i0NODE_2841_length_863_cov_144_740291_g2370_i0_p1_ORF_typecomplete_len209_score57_37GET2/PF08690_10/0_026PAF/PF15715_5/1_8e04PAF/PF15715_5/0_054_NODE_2841_length_863_cov_144_740291_g2370_i0200826